ncbi:MFS transporter [Paracoccus sp. (in: a-proteobacteria)]|uniref:MFS transporter n=1 Tax=Paracoccus sp. TaxID=267 RepID=UPI0028A00311|nr:MFS transporter [Paracoccus sp. (in: a-proteobacteria)]
MSLAADAATAPPSGRWAALGKICLGIIFAMTPWFSATAILPELRLHWEFTTFQAAMMTNGVQVGFVIGALASSFTGLPDIVPIRVLMASAAIAAGLLNLALLIAPGPEAAVFLRILTGIALALVYPPAMKLVTTWFIRGRGIALGLVIGGLTLGSAFPHLIHALTSSVDWRLVVSATSILSMIAGIIFILFVSDGPYSNPTVKFKPSQIGIIVRDKGVALANLGYFGHMWELYAMWGWFLVFMRAALEANGLAPIGQASVITFVVIASGAFGCVAGGWLADRIGRTATTVLMMIVSGLCAIVIGFAFDGPLWALIMISVIWGVSVIGDSAQFSAMVTEIADNRLIGTALAFQMGIGFALTVVSIQLLPTFVGWMGSWQWAFLFLVPGPLIGVIAMLALRRLPVARKIAQGLR